MCCHLPEVCWPHTSVKLLHRVIVATTRASQVQGIGFNSARGPPYFTRSMGGIALVPVKYDNHKVKEMLMLADFSSKGTISVQFGF